MKVVPAPFAPTRSFFKLLFALFAAFALVTTFSASLLAQAVPAPSHASAGTWRQTIGAQHAAMLRSRNEAIQVAALQNLIVLGAQHPGAFNLKPAVPALLDLYADETNDQPLRIMVVAALRAVADKNGMDALYLLSEEEHRASRTYQITQNAVRHYYAEQAMEREEARSAYFLARGDWEKAERHAARAAKYRSVLG